MVARLPNHDKLSDDSVASLMDTMEILRLLKGECKKLIFGLLSCLCPVTNVLSV